MERDVQWLRGEHLLLGQNLVSQRVAEGFMNLREMGGALRLEMDNCSVSVLELHGKEKLSPNWVVGRKGKVNY